MTETSLILHAAEVREARQRLDAAITAYDAARRELNDARTAVSEAEAMFVTHAWDEFGLPTPLDRFVWGGNEKPKSSEDQPSTVEG